MKIFFVHGIGHADLDQNYYVQWETDVTAQLRSCGLQTAPQYEGLTYDPLFQHYDHGPATYAAALVEFLGSAAVSRGRRRRQLLTNLTNAVAGHSTGMTAIVIIRAVVGQSL